MKITFSPSEQATTGQRTAIDAMSNVIARAWLSEDSPFAPGDVIDVRIRYSDYGTQDQIVVSPWNRETGSRTAPDAVVIVDRLHIY